MNRSLVATLVVLFLVVARSPYGLSEDAAKDSLLGVWVARSMESDGKQVPAEHVKRMRFTFAADKLLVRGNFSDGREEECAFRIDAKRSPKHLDFTPPKEKKPVLAIYEVKGDDLRICLRHASSDAGRPTEFATKEGSRLVLMVFNRQKQ